MRVLLIEDDELIAHGILAGLRAHGLTVDEVATAAQAEATLSMVHCDVVILDLGLPDEDGMSLLQRLRAGGMALPVLVLVSRKLPRRASRVELPFSEFPQASAQPLFPKLSERLGALILAWPVEARPPSFRAWRAPPLPRRPEGSHIFLAKP